MTLVALTGGIASGKSTVSRRLAEHGAVVVDADAIVREVQSPGSPVLDRIAGEFGTAVLTPAGELDRAALGGIVFADEDARRRLNELVHPAVREESYRRFAQAFEVDPEAVVVYDVPLLAEARGADSWDLVIVTHAPDAVRRERLVRLRGMTPDDARARIAAQAPDEERLRLADVVIDTAGTMAHTRRQVDELWPRLRALAAPAG